MNMNISVSVIIPTYNEEKSIEKLIDLLIIQSYPIKEIIISDAGSTDRTFEIVNNINTSNIKIIFFKRNGFCRGSGRNSGILSSSNDVIALIDAGCEPEKNWLQNLIKNYKRTNDIVFGSAKPIYNNIFEYCLSMNIISKSNKNDLIIPTVSSMLLNKKSWEDLGRFQESKTGEYIVEDLLFINKIQQSDKNIYYEENAIVNWKMLSNTSEVFRRFSEYSKGGLISGFSSNWHYGILKNIVILLILISLTFLNYFFIPLIIVLVILRSYFYLKFSKYFKSMNIIKKIKTISILIYLLIIIDIASINGFFNWLKK